MSTLCVAPNVVGDEVDVVGDSVFMAVELVRGVVVVVFSGTKCKICFFAYEISTFDID